MLTRLLSTTLLILLVTMSLGTLTPVSADPHAVSPEAFLTEVVVLKATTWAPRGMRDSTHACDLAKDLALAQLQTKVSELRVVERTGTTTFPSHLTCQWDHTRDAYQTILSIELPPLPSLRSLTAERLY